MSLAWHAGANAQAFRTRISRALQGCWQGANQSQVTPCTSEGSCLARYVQRRPQGNDQHPRWPAAACRGHGSGARFRCPPGSSPRSCGFGHLAWLHATCVNDCSKGTCDCLGDLVPPACSRHHPELSMASARRVEGSRPKEDCSCRVHNCTWSPQSFLRQALSGLSRHCGNLR